MTLHRHAALLESTLLRQLPAPLWHHAHNHARDVLRLYLAHGHPVQHLPFDLHAAIARSERAERDARQNARRKAERAERRAA